MKPSAVSSRQAATTAALAILALASCAEPPPATDPVADTLDAGLPAVAATGASLGSAPESNCVCA